MITLDELVSYLDLYLQPKLYKDHCTNGLQIEGKKGIKKIGTAVSANLETIMAAVEAEVDALICHHGLFWSGDPMCIEGSRREKIALLLKEEISLLAYHLPLDGHRIVGNNFRAAQEIGLQQLEPFGEYGGATIGVKGVVPSISIEKFVSKLEHYYEHAAHVALGGKQMITSAALISGGAYKSIIEAARAKVDCFITGNFDEPVWSMAHEERINFVALGHSATERVGPRALAEHLQLEMEIETLFLDLFNPF